MLIIISACITALLRWLWLFFLGKELVMMKTAVCTRSAFELEACCGRVYTFYAQPFLTDKSFYTIAAEELPNTVYLRSTSILQNDSLMGLCVCRA